MKTTTCIASYRIISCCIVSYCIVLYFIVSYRVMLCYVVVSECEYYLLSFVPFVEKIYFVFIHSEWYKLYKDSGMGVSSVHQTTKIAEYLVSTEISSNASVRCSVTKFAISLARSSLSLKTGVTYNCPILFKNHLIRCFTFGKV